MYKAYMFELSTLLFFCIPSLLLILIMLMGNLYVKMNKRLFLLSGIVSFCMFLLSFVPIISVKGSNPVFWGSSYHIVSLIVIAASCLINYTILLKTKKDKAVLLSMLGASLLTLLLPSAIAGIAFVLVLIAYGIVSLHLSRKQGKNILYVLHSISYIVIGGFGLFGQALPVPSAKVIYVGCLVILLSLDIVHIFDRFFSMMSIAGKQSVIDPLTGLYNRGYLMNRLNQLTPEKQFSILFADIDNFKNFNDKNGHERGDQILCQVANQLREVIGNNGFACRYGGEEMVGVILTGDANSIAEMFRKQVEKQIGITVSVGVATGPGKPIEVLRTADELMYKAKVKGKNKVIIV